MEVVNLILIMEKTLFILLISSQLLTAQNLNNLHFGTDTTFDAISWNIEWFPRITILLVKYKQFLQI